jgi:hypothetical protein
VSWKPRATLLVTVADEDIFDRDARTSTNDEVASGACELRIFRGVASQASALNAGIDAAQADLIICPHQDVSFGAGWLETIEQLAENTPSPWGVLGPAGTTLSGQMYGTHSGLGMDGYKHVTAQTLDGSCLILRKSSGLRFDEQLNRFHGYDVDICLESWARGLAVYVIDVPMEHRTRWASTVGQGAQDFQAALRYVADKWHGRGVGPIHTTFGTY